MKNVLLLFLAWVLRLVDAKMGEIRPNPFAKKGL